MGGEFGCIKASHARTLLDDPVDGAWFQRSCRDVAPAVDFSKHTALVDPRGFKPTSEGFDRPTGQINHFILIGTAGFGAPEMNGERGEGGTIFIGEGRLFDKLFCS